MKIPPTRRPRHGFALVVTLTLMVLLSILALGLLSLSSVELRRSGADDSLGLARANARLALMMALGELQVEMGPDRRISAPGGQQLAPGSTSASKNWTGVYDSWSADTGNAITESRPSPSFRRWLISGDKAIVTNESSVKGNSGSASTTVPLTAANRYF